MKIDIADNGYILDDGVSTTVYKCDIDSIRELLYNIVYGLKDTSDRYAKERIEIRIVHGDKYECKDKDCPICNAE